MGSASLSFLLRHLGDAGLWLLADSDELPCLRLRVQY
jgi:hypothetical protein